MDEPIITEKNSKITPLQRCVEDIVYAVKDAVNNGNIDCIDTKWLDRFVRTKSKQLHDKNRTIAKKRLMPTYLKLKKTLGWCNSMGLNDEIDLKITALLKAKPRRTASGVATISVLTKPWPCSGNCIFCPNDIRMPKSYLHNEPACQRAERWGFDPYLQVISRLQALQDMGHNIDKVELIVLGGTFTDYTKEYQTFYIKELFRALNDFSKIDANKALTEYDRERNAGTVPMDISELQAEINAGNLTYNQAWDIAYSHAEQAKENYEKCTLQDLEYEQSRNEVAKHRNVGLVVETRPDKTDSETLIFLRQLGATKIQIGLQTLNEIVLSKNSRQLTLDELEISMANLRTFGFKSHVHMMTNLPGSDPGKDLESYMKLMEDKHFKPDEVKIYPCVCVESARLYADLKEGRWEAYTSQILIDLISKMIAITPAYTRISRVIRDISTCDIIAGNKTPNLRQIIDNNHSPSDASKITEIRTREIAGTDINPKDLSLNTIKYETSNTTEYFLEWVTENYSLAGFLRLSIPKTEDDRRKFLQANGNENTYKYSMIREVHIYGKVAKIHEKNTGVQHAGLGKQLILEAEQISRENGCEKMFVISAVGTREYYEKLGFQKEGLYQAKIL